MLFRETKLQGPRLIEIEKLSDERGFFARTFCERELAAEGLATRYPQHSVSYNARRGTLRGMHFRLPPTGEAKIVRCNAGAILDVIVDVRATSPTFGMWESFEIAADNHRALYIPEGFAHGFQTLTDNTEVFYLISAFHSPELERGFRYDDTSVAIAWPLPVSVISAKDLDWPTFPR